MTVASARERSQGEISLLALFILAGGLATTLSSVVWGRWSDRSSRRTMLAGATLASVVGVLIFAAVHWLPDSLQTVWLWVIGFFALGSAHGGVRMGGRPTWSTWPPATDERTTWRRRIR